ncbi:hypothetical protein EDB85DRAFT_157651 [Lactarius pseudohatsudake]|nr:hypothetical protein EDB85DRAFT_157651 [Lactarius pseudohatsudake]
MLHWLGAKTRRSDLFVMSSTLVLVAESTAKPCRAPEWSERSSRACLERAIEKALKDRGEVHAKAINWWFTA